MFQKEEINKGMKLVTTKLVPHLKKISWKDTSTDGMISYVVHHRFFNNADTKTVLSYLCLEKHNVIEFIELLRESELDTRTCSMAILKTVVDEYIDSRDYKLIQYIYDKDEADIFRYTIYAYLSFAKASSVWMSSIMSWDISFYKFMLIDIICAIPPHMRQLILPTITPDEKFMNRLINLNNKPLEYYYRHKTNMIKNISKTKRAKTH